MLAYKIGGVERLVCQRSTKAAKAQKLLCLRLWFSSTFSTIYPVLPVSRHRSYVLPIDDEATSHNLPDTTENIMLSYRCIVMLLYFVHYISTCRVSSIPKLRLIYYNICGAVSLQR
jgi:hypothetical protein